MGQFMWRFDQGRLDYFQFDEIKQIALALSNISGIPKPVLRNDVIRKELAKFSERPFLPRDYTVWRNYKRVFACSLLATEIEGNIICTELCNYIRSNFATIDVDDYLAHFSRHFYYPSPIFENYNIRDQQIFPIPAIIKYMFSKYCRTGLNYISIQEIGAFLIENNVTGLEPLTFYDSLRSKSIRSDLRQTRELIRFVSQFSFLKWENPNLFFDISDQKDMLNIIKALEPIVATRNPDQGLELLAMGSRFGNVELGNYTANKIESIDTDFLEGNKIRVTHVRTERSNKLKDFYFKYANLPEICNMCTLNTKIKYPWASHIIEIHHLLPLASPIRVENSKTSLRDIVGLCPTCHRATHKYYSKWLKTNTRSDFVSYQEANQIYFEVKGLVTK